jgi:hypothetical protein
MGSGAMIAVYHVYFAPKINFDPTGFVFIMSCTSWVEIKPNGNFYGSIVGYEYVEVYPGGTVGYSDPDAAGFHFPETHDVQVVTYNIVQ